MYNFGVCCSHIWDKKWICERTNNVDGNKWFCCDAHVVPFYYIFIEEYEDSLQWLIWGISIDTKEIRIISITRYNLDLLWFRLIFAWFIIKFYISREYYYIHQDHSHVVGTCPIWSRQTFILGNRPSGLLRFKEYERFKWEKNGKFNFSTLNWDSNVQFHLYKKGTNQD